jgi:hypothetical protein
MAVSGFAFNGIHYVSWWRDEYANYGQATGPATSSMDDLAATGANWAGVLVTCYQANATATAIYTDPQKTPDDSAVSYAIQQLHDRGVKVMLKPHVDGADGSWRGQFNPSDAGAWFNSYSTFMLHYAALAQSLGVEGLILGTEYTLLSGAADQAYWHNLIGAIRDVFMGILTYAANATYSDDEFTRVSFWDKLDLIGLDAYFPLTGAPNPSLTDLVAAWSRNANGNNLIETIHNIALAYNKPIIFTEVGYKSVSGSNTQPWNAALAGGYDPEEQANCYEAFFEVWPQFSSWMQGVFWWDWPVAPPSSTDTDYTPRGKPAEEVLKKWYGPARSSTD